MLDKCKLSFVTLASSTDATNAHKTSLGKKLSGIVIALAVLAIAYPAQATLIHDLAVTNIYNNFTGTGHIEFKAATGTDTSGVSAFDFSGTGPLGSFSFSLGEIENIQWSIDPTTWALSLNLGTSKDQIPTQTQVASCIILKNYGTSGTCGSGLLTTTSSFSRVAQQKIGITSTGGGNLATTPVQAVSAPTPLTLLAVGLAAMGVLRRQTRGLRTGH